MKVGIAGAGIMGRLMAFYLLQAGHEVILFDKSEHHNASMSAAGLLTPLAELEKGDFMIYQMGIQSILQHWPSILTHLPNDIYYQNKGSLLIAHAHDRQELHRYVEHIRKKISDALIPLNQKNISILEPDLKKFDEGYYLSCEGQIDNQHVMTALKHYLIKHRVTWLRQTTVTQTMPYIVKTTNQNYHFDLVIDCRGLGGKNLFNDLRGVRGELVWLHAPDVNISRPVRFLHPRYHLYIAPRPHHIYIVGASEIESEDFSSISLQTLLELLTVCYSLSSHFKQARILKSITQCRPTLPHHNPEIKAVDGLIAVNGLYRHGFLIAPTIAFEIMRWIIHGETNYHYPTLWRQVA